MSDHTGKESDDLLREGRRAARDGDLDTAESHYRQALEQEPSSVRIHKKLARLKEQQARARTRAGDIDGAVRDLREALELSPPGEVRPKLRTRLVRALKTLTKDALAEGDLPTARVLTKEALEVAEDGDIGELRAVLDVPFADRLFDASPVQSRGVEGADSRSLLLIEKDVDDRFLTFVAAQTWPCDAISEQRLKPLHTASGVVRPEALGGLRAIGLDDEMEFSRDVLKSSRLILEQLERCLHRRDRRFGEIDVVEYLAYDVEGAMFRAARSLGVIGDRVRDNRYERVLIVLGRGRLHTCLAPVARHSTGATTLYQLWCSRVLDRYDVRPLPVGEDAADDLRPAATMFASSRTDSGEDGRWRTLALRSRNARRRIRAEARAVPRGAVQLLALPNWLRTRQGEAIAAALARRTDVGVVLKPARSAQDVYAPYRQLVQREARVTVMEHPTTHGRHGQPTRRLGRSVTRSLGTIRTSDALRQSVRIGSLDPWPLAEEELAELIPNQIAELRRQTRAWSTHLDATRPAALVLLADTPAESRVLYELARARGIPTIFPQSFLVSEHPRYRTPAADYITVLDDFARDLFVNHFGVDAERVFVTGIPRFDPILERRNVRFHRPCTDDSMVRRVLFINQRMSPSYHQKLHRLLAESLAEVPNGELIVKMHYSEPATRVDQYQEALADCDRISVRICHQDDVHDLIDESDVVASVFSNVMIEAAMMGRLVLCLNLTQQSLPIPVADQGVALEVIDEANVTTTLRELLCDQAAQSRARARQAEYFERNPHLLARPAAEGVADAVLTAIDRGPCLDA